MSNRTALPETGFVRLSDVLNFIPVGKSSFWAGVKTGKYPQPVKLSKGVTAWRCEDIHELIEHLGKVA